MPIRFEWNTYPVPVCTILIRETISRKNKPNDSIFQVSPSARRECFALLMGVFIRVGKIRLIFSFSSLWGKVGQGEEQAPRGLRRRWRRGLGSPRGIALERCTYQQPVLPSPDFQKASDDRRPELQTRRHRPCIPTWQRDHWAQHQHTPDFWGWPSLGARPAFRWRTVNISDHPRSAAVI